MNFSLSIYLKQLFTSLENEENY
ncbi:hypothetical protein DESC_610051 [Desulfosarcina cetonica]|nr:hypothetical protein DESC_610051 [Desulfosarcina cetonica]